MRTARLQRREWTEAVELLAMVDYVTDTLKTSRLKKVEAQEGICGAAGTCTSAANRAG